MLHFDMMCNKIEILIFGHGVCILYIGGPNFYTLLEHISIYCWSNYLCTSTQLYIVQAHFYALLEHFDINCWNSYLYTSTQFYTLLVHNSIHCSMHCLGWGRHDSGIIIPRKRAHFMFYALSLY
jgi:hypothetical protein